MIRISSDRLNVEASPAGAELQSITDSAGFNWLWHGDATFWTGRAPLLFPVIGKSIGGRVSIDGRTYPMAPHGFARRSRFEVIDSDASSCLMRLTDTAETRTSFPFGFALEIAYKVSGASLSIIATIHNRDSVPMPFCFGFHPAFMLPPSRSGVRVVVLEPGATPQTWRLNATGLVRPETQPSPFGHGCRMRVESALFMDDALICSEAGRQVWYGIEGMPGVQITFPKFPYLGIWTKTGAPFLCIEPWRSLPARVGEQSFTEREGLVTLQPGAATALAVELSFSVQLVY